MTGRLHEQNRQRLVIAKRVRGNTVMFTRLNEFLQRLGLPRVTYTRDSQLYTRAAPQGLSISDLRGKAAAEEQDHWSRIGNWIEHQLAQRQGGCSGPGWRADRGRSPQSRRARPEAAPTIAFTPRRSASRAAQTRMEPRPLAG